MNLSNEIIIILMLALINGFLAMSEAAIISVRKSKLQNLAKKGDRKARAALELSNNPNKFLSTVQFGITLIGIITGAYSGAAIVEVLEKSLGGIAYIGKFANELSFFIVVIVITYINLIIGELVPKRIALNNPVKLARITAVFMKVLSYIGMPFVFLLSISTDFILKIIRVKPSEEPTITEDEIKVLIDHGTREGVFDSAEQSMVEGVFSLGDYKINVLMTTRTKIAWLDINENLEENLKIIYETKFSRFPVCDGSLEKILGIIRVKDILPVENIKTTADFRKFLIQPIFVAEGTKALKMLELFKEGKKHIALVVDEYGTLAGMLTLYDIVEAVVGEIPAYGREEEPSVIKRNDGSYLLDGMLPVSDLKELFSLQHLPFEERKDYDTLGGFVMKQLGKIPVSGEHFLWNNLYFEVVDMDGRRVDKVLAKKLKNGAVS